MIIEIKTAVCRFIYDVDRQFSLFRISDYSLLHLPAVGGGKHQQGTGKITLPLPGEPPAGGHAWCVVGYMDDASVPGGGYFIVRNSWGPNWAAESPEAPGHAMVPYEYVERYAVEAFTGPAKWSTEKSLKEVPAELGRYLRTLDADERDLEGRLVLAGTRVLCDPSDPRIFMEDTPQIREEFIRLDCTWRQRSRQELWFPVLAKLPAESRAELDAARVLRDQFTSAIDENLHTAARSVCPELGLPFWYVLVPWELRIRRCKVVKDLSDELAGEVKSLSGVPDDLPWPEEWQTQLRELNVARVYSLKCTGGLVMRATLHVISAFVCPLAFHKGKPPELLAPTQRVVDAARGAYRRWLAEDGNASSPAFVFITIGVPKPWTPKVTATTGGRCWTVLSSPVGGGQWKTLPPAGYDDRLSIRDFLDRLRPETDRQRLSKVKHVVDSMLEQGYDGNITVKKIQDSTGYRETQVLRALMSLQEDRRHYRVYRTKQRGEIAIDNCSQLKGRKISKGEIEPSWLRRHGLVTVAGVLSPMLGVLIGNVAGYFLGRPISWLSVISGAGMSYVLAIGKKIAAARTK